MTRIQVLLLPSVVVGDDVEEPFALIVDQHTATGSDDPGRWERFKADCGARAVLVTPETVEVVDRYADPAPEADHTDPEDAQLLANWPKLAPTAERGEDTATAPAAPRVYSEGEGPLEGRCSRCGLLLTANVHTGPFIQMRKASDVDPYKVAQELRFRLGKGHAPGQPTARQVIASTLRDDWFFAGEPDHVERLTDAVLAALDGHGLEITRRDDGAPVPDARQRAREWIDGLHKAPEDDQVNCVALLLDAADAAYKCVAEGHKSRLARAERRTSCPGQDRCTGDNCPDPKH